jgi:hypothetical protein
MQPIIDIHVHIMPYHMMKPSALELMKKGRKDYADVERYCANPKAFLTFLDSLGVERAGLINYVAPKIIGFTPEVNDWSAKYCSAAPEPSPILEQKWTALRNSAFAPSRCTLRIRRFPRTTTWTATAASPQSMNERKLMACRS